MCFCHVFLVIYVWFVCLFSLAYQTLGEEYVRIIQVDPTKHQIPSQSRRSLFIFCHVFFPYLLDKVMICVENQLDGVPVNHGQLHAVSAWWSLESWLTRCIQKVLGLMSDPQRRTCLTTVFRLQQSLSLLHRLHLALFYIFGSFYYLSKRTAGITYVRDCALYYIYNCIYLSYSSSLICFQLAPKVFFPL